MKHRTVELALLIGLVVATLGMALVAFGVVVSAWFFPGVYLLAIGLLATAGAGLFRWVGPHPR